MSEFWAAIRGWGNGDGSSRWRLAETLLLIALLTVLTVGAVFVIAEFGSL